MTVSKGLEIVWSGTEDDEIRERLKACRARRKLYKFTDCEKDGSCDECEYDMARALRVKREARP